MSASTRLLPPLDGDRVVVEGPVHQVTLLEDRAQVERRARVQLRPGHNRLRIEGIAPVAQDVSIRAELIEPAGATVADARIRRALRIQLADREGVGRELEKKIEALARRFDELAAQRRSHARRGARVGGMLEQAAREIPLDVAWGVADADGWRRSFEGLFAQRQAEASADQELAEQQQALLRELAELSATRRALERPDRHFVAVAEIDLIATSGGTVELALHYVVPNAMWRPQHRARLVGADGQSPELRFTCQAAVWQNTGEDWEDCTLVFSTARSALGTDPPLLEDDLLEVRKRQEETVVAVREVAIERKPEEGGAPQPQGVELPGVDDGGEIQRLSPEGRVTVRSDGRPHVLPLFRFTGPAQTARVLMAERMPRVVLRSDQCNGARAPILAGPVELLRDRGVVGWTQVGFVAPGAPFALGFGPDQSLRVQRQVSEEEIEDRKTDWTRRRHRVSLFLSNIGQEPRSLEITERIPVSEIEEVEVELESQHTTAGSSLDEDGMLRWTKTLAGGARVTLRAAWRVSVAPGVKGM